MSTPPALSDLCCSDPFGERAYCAMSCFERVEPRCIELVGLAEKGVNLRFEGREIKAAPSCFAFLISHLTLLIVLFRTFQIAKEDNNEPEELVAWNKAT